MLLFEYVYYNPPTGSVTLKITDENFLEMLKFLLNRRPFCSGRIIAEFAFRMSDMKNNNVQRETIMGFVAGHCNKKYGSNWNLDGADNFLYGLLNFYVDSLNKIDIMFDQVFGVRWSCS